MDRAVMKYWVFDLDGTLVDSHGVYFESVGSVLSSCGSDLTAEDKAELLRIAIRDRAGFFSKKIGTSLVQEALEVLNQRLEDDHLRIQPFEGIRDFLETLQKENVKMAVWTARELESAEEVLEYTGLKRYFPIRVSSSCVSICKPDPEGLKRIASLFNCETSEMVMVGDHDNDIAAAKACGAIGIRARWNDSRSEDKCSLADLQFNKVESLKEWFDRS